MQGTWADNIIIQAVADAMNLMIHIIESNENFIEITVVETANAIQNPRSIYIGHIGEMYYISTVAALSERSSNVNSSKSNTNNCKRRCNDEMENQNKQLSGSIVGIPSADSNPEPLILNKLQDDEYRHMVQMLNKEQKEFFYHVLHLIKTSDKPFYCFLSGGAGVGKSYLAKALYQAALKYYNTRAGVDCGEI